MELEELQAKIEHFLDINKELMELGMCDATHDGDRRYLQSMFDDLMDLVEKYQLGITISTHDDIYQWSVAVPELKMYAIATDDEVKRRGLLPDGDSDA